MIRGVATKDTYDLSLKKAREVRYYFMFAVKCAWVSIFLNEIETLMLEYLNHHQRKAIYREIA
jgi:hypothetical protein